MLSNYHKYFMLPLIQFIDFDYGVTTVEISHAESIDGSLSRISTVFSKEKIILHFNCTQHYKSPYYDVGFYESSVPLPYKLEVGQTFKTNISFT